MSPLDLLRKFVEEVRSSNYAPPIDWQAPERTWEPSYAGGDCSKHGRYYGHCHCCADDYRHAQNIARREHEHQKRSRLEELAKAAEALLK